MSSVLYDQGRQGILNGLINVATDTIKCLLATSGYTPNTNTDQMVSIIGGGNIVARSGAFASKSEANGVFGAANVTLLAVSGSAVSYIVIYKDTGTDSTSRLIAIIDTATGLPFTPTGGDVTITWDTGADKIFKL